MTISVTPEELKGHEANCRDWANKRTHFLETAIANAYNARLDSFGGGSLLSSRTELQTRIKTWESEHPFPKLLPDV